MKMSWDSIVPPVLLCLALSFGVQPFLFAGGRGNRDQGTGTSGSSAPQAAVPFNWYMWVIDPQGESVDFQNSVAIPDRASFRVRIYSQGDCYCYVLLMNDAVWKAAVFSDSPLARNSFRDINGLEAGSAGGRNVLTVIMTGQRQDTLEGLISAYQKSSSRDSFTQLQTELNRLAAKKANPEPIVVGGAGTSKGGEPSPELEGSKPFTGKSEYFWNMSIESE